MDDYSALAYRIAGGVADVRGCLILSRDGLILGAYPDDETAVKPAWVKFASLGEPERSFVEFGDQVWVFVRRPAYGAFAVADAGVRPGLVIDQLEQMLLSAEEARSRRETLRVPEASGAPSGKPRTSLHPSAGRVEPAAAAGSTPAAGAAPAPRPWARGDASMLRRSGGGAEAAGQEPADGRAPGPVEDAPADTGDTGVESPADVPGKKVRKKGEKEAQPQAATKGSGDSADADSMDLDADAVVDPVLLAKEFSGLLQVESGDDEGSS